VNLQWGSSMSEQKRLQDAVMNAAETLADALDDTSCLGPAEIAEAREELDRAVKAELDFEKESV
jgi:hypothetical protein